MKYVGCLSQKVACLDQEDFERKRDEELTENEGIFE